MRSLHQTRTSADFQKRALTVIPILLAKQTCSVSLACVFLPSRFQRRIILLLNFPSTFPPARRERCLRNFFVVFVGTTKYVLTSFTIAAHQRFRRSAARAARPACQNSVATRSTHALWPSMFIHSFGWWINESSAYISHALKSKHLCKNNYPVRKCVIYNRSKMNVCQKVSILAKPVRKTTMQKRTTCVETCQFPRNPAHLLRLDQ